MKKSEPRKRGCPLSYMHKFKNGREEKCAQMTFVETAVLFLRVRKQKRRRFITTQKSTRRTEKRREAWHKRNRRRRRGGATDLIFFFFSTSKNATKPHYITRTPPSLSLPLASSFDCQSRDTKEKKKKKKEVDLPTEKCSSTITHERRNNPKLCVCLEWTWYNTTRHDKRLFRH